MTLQVKAEQENFEDDLASLRVKFEAKKSEVEDAEERMQQAVLGRAKVSQEISAKEEEYKKEKRELTDLKSSTNPLSKAEREINNNISTKTKEILNQEKLVKKLSSELESLKEEQKKQRDDASQFEAAAKKITGKEIVPERTVKQLNAKILQLQKKIKSKQDENLDQQEFLESFQDLKERYQDMRGQIEQLENLLQKILKMNNERLDNFQIIRQIISNNVRRRFNKMISTFAKQIGCQVFLRIDNNRKEVTFSFQNLEGGEERDSSDVSRLSGGEKSFTQMCFICALWDMMEPPFRCLDEWDVFLDAVNRKAISKELLNFSLKNQSKQFIFISPQVMIISFEEKKCIAHFRGRATCPMSTMVSFKSPRSRSPSCEVCSCLETLKKFLLTSHVIEMLWLYFVLIQCPAEYSFKPSH